MKRNNKDCERCNLFGKTLVELCCVHNMHIMNARLHDDVDGNFTCLTSNGCSVVDYHIASTPLSPYVRYFKILERDESDHLPIHSTLSFTQATDTSEQSDYYNSFSYSKYLWNERYA